DPAARRAQRPRLVGGGAGDVHVGRWALGDEEGGVLKAQPIVRAFAHGALLRATRRSPGATPGWRRSPRRRGSARRRTRTQRDPPTAARDRCRGRRAAAIPAGRAAARAPRRATRDGPRPRAARASAS